MRKNETGKDGRRSFLKLASLGGAVGGLAALLPGRRAEATPAAPEAVGRGYRETDHVRKVYNLARF